MFATNLVLPWEGDQDGPVVPASPATTRRDGAAPAGDLRLLQVDEGHLEGDLVEGAEETSDLLPLSPARTAALGQVLLL